MVSRWAALLSGVGFSRPFQRYNAGEKHFPAHCPPVGHDRPGCKVPRPHRLLMASSIHQSLGSDSGCFKNRSCVLITATQIQQQYLSFA
jgi:hypothetical protein